MRLSQYRRMYKHFKNQWLGCVMWRDATGIHIEDSPFIVWVTGELKWMRFKGIRL